MQRALSPYAAAGVALATASVIAATPIIDTAPHIQSRTASTSVELAALTNSVVDPWITQFNAASANMTQLAHEYFLAPGPDVQQAVVNQVGYLNTLLNDPASIGTVIQSIGANAQKVLEGLTYIGLESGTFPLGRRLLMNNDYLHTVMAQYLPLYLPADMDPQTVQIAIEVVKALGTPLSGVLIGFAGPIVSPAVALLNSVQAIAGELGTDPAAALQTLMATPANVVGAFFNGATLDLSAVLPLVNGSMPEGTSIDALSVAFGGLLTAGNTAWNPAGELVTFGPGHMGGSILNSIGLSITRPDGAGNPSTMVIAGNAVGPLGALAKLSQVIAKELGWDGKGNPLTNLKFPEINQGTATNATVDPAPHAVTSATGIPERPQLESADTADTATATGDNSASVAPTTSDTVDTNEDTMAAVPPAPAKRATVPLTRQSLAATPGKASAKVASDVRDGIADAVNKIGEGVKKVFSKPVKPAKADTAKSDAGGSGSTKHRAGDGNSGDAK